MSFRSFLPVLILFLAFPAVAEESKGDSGLKTPRFASLRNSEAHVRTGPSQEYPIKWTYQRQGLPVEIVQEYGPWRKIKDQEGGSGWVHKILLSGQRTVLVLGKEPLEAWEKPDRKTLVARIDPGVIGKIEECDPALCLVHFSSLKGWVKKNTLWGIYPSEVLN